MTKQAYLILGIILIIVLVLAGAVLVREKKQGSVELITPPAPVTPTPPTPTPETRQPENSPNTQTSKTPTPAGWKMYENKEFGFAFDYPEEWEVKDVSPGIELRKQNNFNFAKIFLQVPRRKSNADVSLQIEARYSPSHEKGFYGESKVIKLSSGIEAYYLDDLIYQDFIINVPVNDIIVTFDGWRDEINPSIKMNIVNTFRLIERSD